MRKIKEVLRLKHSCRLSTVKIALSCNISRESVRLYLLRASAAGLNWPVPEDLDDEQLEGLLFPTELISARLPQPDCQQVHQELKRKGMTLWLLWEEYKANYPDGMSYSRFCQLYHEFKGTLSVSMRQTHVAGEKLFVDYAHHHQAPQELFLTQISEELTITTDIPHLISRINILVPLTEAISIACN